MAQPTNVYSTYDSIGIREDLSDLIYNISPTETPFISMIGTATAKQTLHEWQIDNLASPASNVAVEGDDPTLGTQNVTTRRGNRTQISTKVFGVTGTDEVVDKAGRDSELAYLAARAARELKTDVDFHNTGVSQAAVTGNDTTGRQSASLESWLATNTSRGSMGADPTGDGTDTPTDGTLRALALSLVDAVIQSAWSNGGRPSVLLTGPSQKTNLSALDGVAPRRVDAAERTIYGSADMYVSNFGDLTVVPSRHIRSTSSVDRNIFAIDPEYARIAYLRPWQQFDLAKTGDNVRRQMLVEWTLEMCNEAAHGIVADLS